MVVMLLLNCYYDYFHSTVSMTVTAAGATLLLVKILTCSYCVLSLNGLCKKKCLFFAYLS